MSDVVIKAEGLGKKYVIGHQAENERYTALRDVMVRNMRGVWDKTRDLLQGKPVIQGDTYEEVWALKDVDFEIRRGEAVGIIGRNGAGKSTLLKILSRITEPSAGRVTIRGRVASLLEVGTGFHPELTGRENIYLNGAILGMTRAEIKRKFDEIVDFAGVEQFLDTPVKRFSSGMYVRLAFAVAAHLEPEILVVDEVLAVGDAEFQKKCLGKMGDVASEGRTVLFVSHNMGAISTLCRRALLLDQGSVSSQGESQRIIFEYQQIAAMSGTEDLDKRTDRRGEGGIRFTGIQFLDTDGESVTTAISGMPLLVQLRYKAERNFSALDFAVGIRTITGTRLMLCNATNDTGPFTIAKGEGIICCTIQDLPLADGTYYLNLAIQQSGMHYDWIERAATLDVVSLDYFQNGSSVQKGHSPILVRSHWTANDPPRERAHMTRSHAILTARP